MHPRAAALIEQLGLIPHPEGGFYRELHKSGVMVQPLDDRPRRTALTTIYFLLTEGAHSRWHRVESDEVWHLYEGAPLELFQAAPDGDAPQRIVLGPALGAAPGDDIDTDEHSLFTSPVHAVPARCWQAARSLGPYTLVGCTVGPGFDFADFSFLRDAPDALARIRRHSAALAELA